MSSESSFGLESLLNSTIRRSLKRAHSACQEAGVRLRSTFRPAKFRDLRGAGPALRADRRGRRSRPKRRADGTGSGQRSRAARCTRWRGRVPFASSLPFRALAPFRVPAPPLRARTATTLPSLGSGASCERCERRNRPCSRSGFESSCECSGLAGARANVAKVETSPLFAQWSRSRGRCERRNPRCRSLTPSRAPSSRGGFGRDVPLA